ncbi:hypothetical protein [Ureibacillus sp. GCM10028918]|uniref:hypothetical protein n=1 Tax=Ureibacillus sp. GCM10028918 TaxID=3273429 RepID=UPI0036F4327C
MMITVMIMTVMEEVIEEEDVHDISTRFSRSSLFIQSTHRTIPIPTTVIRTTTDHTTDLMVTNISL